MFKVIELIRRVRHGPLKFLAPGWVSLGQLYRRAISGSGLAAQQKIGPYGPFKLDAKFAFSDFSKWGDRHNDGFRRCVEFCRGKNCVLDIGSHIGLVSLPAASVMAPDGRLVAFEPATENRVLLARHVDLNGLSDRVIVEDVLVGGEDCDNIPFHELSDATGMNSVVGAAVGDDYRKVLKQQVTLDTYCNLHGLQPQVIKIDVEGAELEVLRGGREVLTRCRPHIFLSVHPRHIALQGESLDALAALIRSLGYECRYVDGSPVTEFGLREYLLTPQES